MANENKVRQLTEKSKNIFLREVFKTEDEKPHIYNLDEEFAKTKKNKSPIVVLSVTGFVIVVFLITVAIVSAIEEKNKKLVADIGDFQDVNLTELLSTVKKNEVRLDQAKTSLANLGSKKAEEIRKSQAQFAKLREETLLKKLPKSEETAALQQLQIREQNELSTLNNRFDREAAQLRGQISKVQGEIDQYDQRLQETARRAEETINNFKKLHEIRMAQQRTELISRYDPSFSLDEGGLLIDSVLVRLPNQPQPPKYRLENLIHAEKAITSTNLHMLRKNTDEQLRIIAKLRTIPYQNSMAQGLDSVDRLSRNSIASYENLLQDLSQRISKKNEDLKHFRYAIEFLASEQSEGGYIIDARNPESVKTILNRSFKVNNGDTALVFRADDEYIGKILFLESGSRVKAKIIEISPSQSMKPFDKIMLRLEKE